MAVGRISTTTFLLGIGAWACLLPAPARTGTIDRVTVGNPGNANDTRGSGIGAAADSDQNGRYDVTIGQHKRFLNAVAATDTDAASSTFMKLNVNNKGISSAGSIGRYTFSTIGSADRPSVFMRWFDATSGSWLRPAGPKGCSIGDPPPAERMTAAPKQFHSFTPILAV